MLSSEAVLKGSLLAIVLVSLVVATAGEAASNPQMYGNDKAKVKRIASDIDITKLDAPEWMTTEPLRITTYWSGKRSPKERQFSAWLLWSDKYLYVRFVAPHSEPPVVSKEPDLTKKTIGLWDRDVCEVFIAPDKGKPNKYFEFEIAPTGEWIDLGIEVTKKERLTDWKYASKMESTATDVDGVTYAAIKIPFESLGGRPKVGDVWLGNVFRCIGSGTTRGYLAWRPTRTPKPNFHVPDAFGEFHFVR